MDQPIEIDVEERLDTSRENNGASLEPVPISEEVSAPAVDEASAISADTEDSANINAPAEITEIDAAQEETPTVDALVEPADMPQLKARKTTRAFVKQSTPSSQAEDNASTEPKSLLHEMADLDIEIDALRRHLVGKLSQQNAQLRKMLARFDANSRTRHCCGSRMSKPIAQPVIVFAQFHDQQASQLVVLFLKLEEVRQLLIGFKQWYKLCLCRPWLGR